MGTDNDSGDHGDAEKAANKKANDKADHLNLSFA